MNSEKKGEYGGTFNRPNDPETVTETAMPGIFSAPVEVVDGGHDFSGATVHASSVKARCYKPGVTPTPDDPMNATPLTEGANHVWSHGEVEDPDVTSGAKNTAWVWLFYDPPLGGAAVQVGVSKSFAGSAFVEVRSPLEQRLAKTGPIGQPDGEWLHFKNLPVNAYPDGVPLMERAGVPLRVKKILVYAYDIHWTPRENHDPIEQSVGTGVPATEDWRFRSLPQYSVVLWQINGGSFLVESDAPECPGEITLDGRRDLHVQVNDLYSKAEYADNRGSFSLSMRVIR